MPRRKNETLTNTTNKDPKFSLMDFVRITEPYKKIAPYHQALLDFLEAHPKAFISYTRRTKSPFIIHKPPKAPK